MIRTLLVTFAALVTIGVPRLVAAQEDYPIEPNQGGTLVIQPVDGNVAEEPLSQVADAPTAREATAPRPPEHLGPLIHPGAYFKNGYYRGVVPGEGHIPPKARRLKRTKQNYVTWPGFEIGEVGSRIFIQSTRPVTYRRADEPNRIVLILDRTRINLQNNHNPLVTDHFNTPVAETYLRHQRRDTVLVLEMKVNVEPRIHQVSENGYHFLFLEFPDGSYPIPTQIRKNYRLSDRIKRAGGDDKKELTL
jgi:hypothetical protein